MRVRVRVEVRVRMGVRVRGREKVRVRITCEVTLTLTLTLYSTVPAGMFVRPGTSPPSATILPISLYMMRNDFDYKIRVTLKLCLHS